jgi:hypothetical protein
VLGVAVAIAIAAAACRLSPPSPAPPGPPPPGQLKFSPVSIDYGTHPLAILTGATMPIVTVSVTNTGDQTVRLLSETSSNGIFSLPADTCSGSSLAPGQSCAIDLQFCPSAPGTANSTLTVTGMTGAINVSVTANVTGTAT